MKMKNESGMALITALLILILMGTMLQVIIVKVNSSQKELGMERDQDRSFAGAYAALNQITQEMANLLDRNALTPEAILDLMNKPIQISNKKAEIDEEGNTIWIDHDGNKITIESPKITVGATSPPKTIMQGALQGLWANITTYTISITARSSTGDVVTLEREVQIASIPVFQFGVFSESDLEFSAGADFDFGGRVHTNGNLHLLSGGEANRNAVLKLVDRVSAVGKILRRVQMNGRAFDTVEADSKDGPVSMARPAGGPRNLKQDEGNDSPGGKSDDAWERDVYSQYDGYLRNGKTGALKMELPLVSGGLQPYEIIHRAPKNEDTSEPVVFEQRFSSIAGLRILLSDTQTEIMDLPGVDRSKLPVLLQTDSGGLVFAESSVAADFTKISGNATGAPLIGGFIKIEMRTSNSLNSWKDVTSEILSYGYTGASIDAKCANAYPNAIIRVQRFKEDLTAAQTNTSEDCRVTASNAQNLWSNALFDSREGTKNNDVPTTLKSNNSPLYLGGIMHYIELDIGNLGRWIRREAGSDYVTGSGNQVYREETGYVVYFSDRRGSQNDAARYMYENSGQDSDGDGVARTMVPSPSLTITKSSTGEVYTSTISAPSPLSTIDREVAKRTSPLYFRRALKLVNGGKIELGTNTHTNVPYGLTLAAENPIYVQGDYNANQTVFNDVGAGSCTGACEFKQGNHSVPAAVIADAVTLLSNNWTDSASFNDPYVTNSLKWQRLGTTTYYRMAIVSGKNKPFHYSTGGPEEVATAEWGSDGGVHNFLRMLEDWQANLGYTMFYNGSMVSLYYSQQANAPFKFRRYGGMVYSAPVRKFFFDNEYTDVDKLPPRTPMLRSINVLSFSRTTKGNR